MSLEQLQQHRKEAAQRLFAQGHVKMYDENTFTVKSETNYQVYDVYKVEGHLVCDCIDYYTRSKHLKCKHELAVELLTTYNET
jgi:hypothetical protein